MNQKTIKVSESLYRRIVRIAERNKRKINATVELAFDHMERLVKKGK